MLYYTNSKDFIKLFLNNEKDKDILDCQYVLISYRIRSGGSMDNVLAYNALYPNSDVMVERDKESFREAYYRQLKDYKSTLAILIKGSIEKKYNIIFICSKKENNVGYLGILADYIYEKFGYPVYEYSDYVNCKCDMVDFNKYKVLEKCERYIEKSKYEKISDKELIKMIKKKPKKLIKILKKYDYDLTVGEIEIMSEEDIKCLAYDIRKMFNSKTPK